MAVIFQTYSVSEAHLKVHVTQNSGLADIFVYSVSNVGMAKGDTLWFMTESRARATSRIYLSDLAEAALVVFFVGTRAQAGWKKKSFSLSSLSCWHGSGKCSSRNPVLR